MVVINVETAHIQVRRLMFKGRNGNTMSAAATINITISMANGIDQRVGLSWTFFNLSSMRVTTPTSTSASLRVTFSQKVL